eukprot:9013190-Pyramimonas_sp.AAC.1
MRPPPPNAALCSRRFTHPVQRFVAPSGAPPKKIVTIAVFTTAYGWVFCQANFFTTRGGLGLLHLHLSLIHISEPTRPEPI